MINLISAKIVLATLKTIRTGQLTLKLPDGTIREFGKNTEVTGTATVNRAYLTVHHWSAFRHTLLRGDIGFAEAFMRGLWTTDNLNDLLDIIVQNREILDRPIRGLTLTNVINKIRHWLNKNTKSQAKKNIEAHYDLGNDFYSLWLDETMSYSSGLFRGSRYPKTSDLKEAQLNKIDRAINRLGYLGEKSSTLEIGCGWGGLAVERLKNHPGKHTGITLSNEQRIWAEQLMRREELSERCTIELRDYRDVTGIFDGIVSIEMIEAVGRDYWITFFETISTLLKPGGRAVIQAITIDEHLFNEYESGVDFIQTYIFPGGMLMTKNHFYDFATKANLTVSDALEFGQDYASTLLQWHDRFITNWLTIKDLGFDNRFKNMWEFYLAYCRSGFLNKNIDVVQFTLTKAQNH